MGVILWVFGWLCDEGGLRDKPEGGTHPEALRNTRAP